MNLQVRFRPQLRIGLVLLTIASVITISAIYAQRSYGFDQDLGKLNRFVQNKGNTASMQIFREGRDFIEAQNWQRAAEKFNDFIKGYPKDKDLDAALYWYGYALQKQDRKEEARQPLVLLINRFPGSSWRQEAQALLVTLGHKDDVDQALSRDNCEIKMLALQSLFEADEERAIAIATDAIKANPQTCPNFPAAAVSMLGSHAGPRAIPLLVDIARTNPDQKLRLTAIKRLGEQRSDQVTDELIKIYDTDRTKEIRTQVLRALVEGRTSRGTAKVIEIARAGDDLAVRQYAIRFMSELEDPASLDELIRIYDADKTKEIRSQILRALAERDDQRARNKLFEIARQGETPELRIEAIRRLGDNQRISLDELLQLYTSEPNPQIKQALLRTFADSNDPRAREKLYDIARGNDPVELRGYAIRQLGEKDDEATVNQLVSLYDAEKDLQLKTYILRAFGDSKQKVAVRKLMSIARNDPSVEMRKLAVRFLGESKDPEALKFLEDLLK
ncbi:MAG TPA: HEAT repeat domain-containing protein [Pyrinomonadaceae bacterium]|jgi:HEAT repeat protein|nr:HEAT repeat domain-containing protein [Pyrinomonadaceae bacterium]